MSNHSKLQRCYELKGKRLDIGLTQKGLARLTGISLNHIYKMESTERFGSDEAWNKINKVLEEVKKNVKKNKSSK